MDEISPGSGGGMREMMLQRFDKDGDGKISAEEKQAGREMMMKRRGRGRGHGGALKEELMVVRLIQEVPKLAKIVNRGLI